MITTSKNALDPSAGTSLGTALRAVDSLTSLDIRQAMISLELTKYVLIVQCTTPIMYWRDVTVPGASGSGLAYL